MRLFSRASFLSLAAVAAVAAGAAGAADARATPSPSPSPSQTPSATASATAADATAANDFGFAMYGQIKKGGGNLFFSAPSLREALGIAYLGARGTTASEMAIALHLDPDPAKSAAAAKDEIASWNAARGGAELSIANRLWVDKSFGVLPAFGARASAAYGAATDSIDFFRAPTASRLAINAWVSEKTHDRIRDLLPDGSIHSDTRVVITNATYFKGDWAAAFEKEATRDAPFAVDGTTKRDVPTMHETGTFATASGNGARVLELGYAKSDLAMDIVLPDAADGLSKIEDDLSSSRLAAWTSRLAPQRVAVSLPKVKITWGGTMQAPLQALGMKTAFDDGAADFSGIAPARDAGGRLYVSAVFHKAFVAIDEKGTEAAAATAVVLADPSAAESAPQKFTVDHPFLFVIRDVKRGRVLFMGRVNDPKAG